MVLNQYGLGKTVYFAFDAGLALDGDAHDIVADMLRKSIAHVHNDTVESVYPLALIPAGSVIEQAGDPVSLRITKTFSPELSLYDPENRQWFEASPWNKEFSLQGLLSLPYFYLIPDIIGDYSAETLIQIEQNGVFEDYREFERVFTVDKTAKNMMVDVISDLRGMSVSFWEKLKLNTAAGLIETAKNRTINNRYDIEANIWTLISAVHTLFTVNEVDIADIRLEIDQLIRIEQARLYYYE